MTSGTVTTNLRTTVTVAGIEKTASTGVWLSRNWSGGDAISTSKPRVSYPFLSRPKGFIRWKTAKRHGRRILPPQNYSVTYQYYYYDAILVRYASSSKDSLLQPSPASSGDLAMSFDVKQEYKLLADLRAAVYGSGFNPAVFLAEAPQAFRMIGDAAQRIGGAYAAIRARNPKLLLKALRLNGSHKRAQNLARSVRDKTKPVGEVWIEAQYGWMPLLSDAEDGARWLAEAVTGKIPGKLSRSRTWRATAVSTAAIPKNSYRYMSAEHEWRLRYVIEGLKISNTFAPSFATLATVAWEVTPWSFIVDWFVPIGSYLESLRTAADIKGTVVRSLKHTTTYRDLTFSSSITKKGSWVMGRGTQNVRTEFSRSVSTEIQVPHPLAYVLDKKTYCYSSWKHAANAVALLSQQDWPQLLDGIKKLRNK